MAVTVDTPHVAAPVRRSRSTRTLTEEQQLYWRQMCLIAVDEELGQPYIATMIFTLRPVNAPGLRTMAVDPFGNCYVDFDFFMPQGVLEGAKVLAHEPWHLLRGHEQRFLALFNLPEDTIRVNAKEAFERSRSTRLGWSRLNKAWNVAGDLEINDDITDRIAAWMIHPARESFKAYPLYLTAEDYMNQLLKDEATLSQYAPAAPACSCGQQHGPHREQNPTPGGQDDAEGQESSGSESDVSDGQPGSSPDGETGDNATGGSQPGPGATHSAGDGQQDGQGQETGNDNQSGAGTDQSDTPDSQPSGPGAGIDSEDQSGPVGDGNTDGGQQPIDPDCPIHGEHQIINCGGGAGNDLGEWQLEEDELFLSPDDIAMRRRQVAQDTEEFFRRNPPGTARGKSAYEWAKKELAPTPTNWRSVLRTGITRGVRTMAGRTMHSYKRVSRRQGVYGRELIMPGNVKPKVRVIMGVDTSGSHVHALQRVAVEVEQIIRKVGISGEDFMAFTVDVEVHQNIHQVKRASDLFNDAVVGGGTLMRPAYEYVAGLRGTKRPNVFVLVTDGELFEGDLPTGGLPGLNGIHVVTAVTLDGDQNSPENQKRIANVIRWVGAWSDVLPLIDVEKS